MNNSIPDLIRPQLERELHRHCTDAELAAHAKKADDDRPAQQAWVQLHLFGGGGRGLKGCSMCQSRLRFFVVDPEAGMRKDSAQWLPLGDVWVRSIPIEAGIEADGTPFLFGAAPREQSLHMGESAPSQPASVIELPNKMTIDVKVAVVERNPRLYEVELASTRNPNVLFSVSQAAEGSMDAPPTEIDLSSERQLRRAELRFSSKVRLQPGVWHLGFWSRVPGEPWTVVELILHADDAGPVEAPL